MHLRSNRPKSEEELGYEAGEWPSSDSSSDLVPMLRNSTRLVKGSLIRRSQPLLNFPPFLIGSLTYEWNLGIQQIMCRPELVSGNGARVLPLEAMAGHLARYITRVPTKHYVHSCSRVPFKSTSQHKSKPVLPTVLN